MNLRGQSRIDARGHIARLLPPPAPGSRWGERPREPMLSLGSNVDPCHGRRNGPEERFRQHALDPRPSTLDPLAAITLLELLLVLALLGILTALAAPALSNFFRARAMDSEARQLLSLTHAGRARAVSSGFPVLLWIDPDERAYGLEEETISTTTATTDQRDRQAQAFTLNDNVTLEPLDAHPVTLNGRTLPTIRFLPDGTVDENSPRALRLTGRNSEALWLVQTTNRFTYEIRDRDR